MSSAGPSRPRVITLTADQLLGTSLTPARPHRHAKTNSAPRVLTIEDLVGTGLTVARPASRPAPTRPAPRAAPRAPPPRAPASSSTRTTLNPRLVRVTADEVLRTGIPVRTLQAVKARSGQAQPLTAEELLAATSPTPSGSRITRGRAISSGLSSGSSSGASSSRPTTAPGAGSTTGRTLGSPSTGNSHGTRQAAQPANRVNEGSGASASTHGRNARQARRSNSLGSTRTLPMYTQEPGESEVVISRGANELEDGDGAETPITAMSPVDENEPNSDATAVAAGSIPSPPASPDLTEGPTISRQLSPVDASSPAESPLPSGVPSLPPWTSIYPDAAPSYEAVMSTPNLHVYHNSPAPSSPILIPSSFPWNANPSGSPPYSASPVLRHATPSSALASSGSPVSTSPGPGPGPVSTSPRPSVRVVAPHVPAASRTSPGSRSPGSPSSSPGERSDGADTHRRRFGFMSLFHSRSSSRLRARSHSHSHSLSSPQTGPSRVASPELLAPVPTRPFHRLSQSASGSMLDLVSRSRADS
ncbi:hypothetical protein C2E23DRAFT_817187 [Lenzites betulinus]|nr:hypothetical protein C2E23DRAFT_817187 [Lenzites betulinus]